MGLRFPGFAENSFSTETLQFQQDGSSRNVLMETEGSRVSIGMVGQKTVEKPDNLSEELTG